jgi:pimeloyl-ACP methyl ester carboxylesterase
VVPALLPHFHVYASDTRGHGDSDQPQDPEAYWWYKSGQDMLHVIEAVSGGGAVRAVGHSAGAAHLCYVAIHRPGCIDGAVLIDPIIGPPNVFGDKNPLEEPARRRRNVFDDREAAKARYASKLPMNAWAADVLDAYVLHGFRDQPDGTVALKCPGTIEAEVYARGGMSEIFDRLGEINFPVELVTADGSDVRRLAEMQRERFKNVRFHLVPGASHFIPQEKPAEIAALIVRALAE